MDINKVKEDLYDSWSILSKGSTASVSGATRVITHCKGVIRALDPIDAESICEELNVVIDTFEKTLNQELKKKTNVGYDAISEAFHRKTVIQDCLTRLESECADIILGHAVKNGWFSK